MCVLWVCALLLSCEAHYEWYLLAFDVAGKAVAGHVSWFSVLSFGCATAAVYITPAKCVTYAVFAVVIDSCSCVGIIALKPPCWRCTGTRTVGLSFTASFVSLFLFHTRGPLQHLQACDGDMNSDVFQAGVSAAKASAQWRAQLSSMAFYHFLPCAVVGTPLKQVFFLLCQLSSSYWMAWKERKVVILENAQWYKCSYQCTLSYKLSFEEQPRWWYKRLKTRTKLNALMVKLGSRHVVRTVCPASAPLALPWGQSLQQLPAFS